MVSLNSTNVRSSSVSWAQRAVRAVAAVAPTPGAALVAELFVRVPERRRVPEGELALLRQAERLSFNFDGERLVAHRFGTGPAVLLLHGWGGSGSQLQAFVEPLLERGYSVVALDAPGHGASTGRWLAIPRYARAILRAQQQLGPFEGLIAHSMGGAAAARAIGLGLPVKRAVFIGPPASEYEYFQQWARPFALSAEAMQLAKSKLEDRVGITFEELSAPFIAPHVSVPLLVIHDEQDREVPWRDGAAIAAAAPNAHLRTTQGLGHRRILKDPTVVRSALEFLRQSDIASTDRSNAAEPQRPQTSPSNAATGSRSISQPLSAARGSARI